ncbi:MAG TPA: hypothetical protein VFR99_05985 [Marmoricola sp.]|nr:hypothetical protein [Marmoricola sp.]
MTRRALTALGVAGLLCLGLLSACSDHPEADGVVPWTDEPAQGALLAQSTTAPQCRLAALTLPRGQQAWGGAWHDAVSGYFVIQNSGRTRCRLAAPSRVVATTPEGPRVFSTGRVGDTTVTLDPGDGVQVQVSSPYDCGRRLLRSTGFVLSLPSGRLHVPRARMAVQCGGELADFSGRDTSTPPTTPAASLRARLTRVPGRVGPGGTLSYTVTLTNPTSRRIRLDQCPSYEEGIKGQPSSVRRYQLNCDDAPPIGPHRSVTFAMQLPLPDHVDDGPAVLNWHLQVPGAVGQAQFASARTTVH